METFKDYKNSVFTTAKLDDTGHCRIAEFTMKDHSGKDSADADASKRIQVDDTITCFFYEISNLIVQHSWLKGTKFSAERPCYRKIELTDKYRGKIFAKNCYLLHL